MARILLYGGSGAIGTALAERLYQQGSVLHLVGRNEERLKAAATRFGASFTCGDVTDPDLFARVTADFSAPYDGLVYAVGTITLGSLRRLTAADFLQDFTVNAMGAALAVQAALPALKKSDNHPGVVLFSSVAASQGFTFHASIGMAKGAVSSLTLALAAELAPRIRVNAIAPSLSRTPLAQAILANEQMAQSLAELHPLQRLGEPSDSAGLAAFLLSPEASWLTGQIIGVDGGRSTLRVKG